MRKEETSVKKFRVDHREVEKEKTNKTHSHLIHLHAAHDRRDAQVRHLEGAIGLVAQERGELDFLFFLCE